MFEQPLVSIGRDVHSLWVQRESADTFPDTWRWTREDGFVERITDNTDPFPDITAVERRHFDYTRRDGLEVQGHVWMPVGWQEGDAPAPAMIWTYPSEYETPKDYANDALGDWNVNRFDHLSYLRWSLLWVHQGYALVHPDVPIVGDQFNNNYIQHLSDSLYAAIRELDNLGLVDPDRIGHGGHSYGAFATGNLLTRTPYFKAGIAGDGAYNRTLTPLGFQRESRYLWQARETYLEMSPFFHADHMDTPLLMYHGGSDNNTGTFPIQSRRFMQALQGLDKEAVLYEYPFESHGPRAIESYLDLWKRFVEFFDMHVKNPMPETEDE
jgi:dipeptidyl aminopeptidase/acylaminoacyl peptidase